MGSAHPSPIRAAGIVLQSRIGGIFKMLVLNNKYSSFLIRITLIRTTNEEETAFGCGLPDVAGASV